MHLTFKKPIFTRFLAFLFKQLALVEHLVKRKVRNCYKPRYGDVHSVSLFGYPVTVPSSIPASAQRVGFFNIGSGRVGY